MLFDMSVYNKSLETSRNNSSFTNFNNNQQDLFETSIFSWQNKTNRSTSSSNSSFTSQSSDLTIGTIKQSSDGVKLANIANDCAKELSSTGWCLKGVNNSLEKMYGIRVGQGSAYQAAADLSNMPDKFSKVTGKVDLTTLPAGAIVVWDKNDSHPYGHISVALGNGYEASDHLAKQYTHMTDSYTVFLPK